MAIHRLVLTSTQVNSMMEKRTALLYRLELEKHKSSADFTQRQNITVSKYLELNTKSIIVELTQILIPHVCGPKELQRQKRVGLCQFRKMIVWLHATTQRCKAIKPPYQVKWHAQPVLGQKRRIHSSKS
jgi:hypothetical protein